MKSLRIVSAAVVLLSAAACVSVAPASAPAGSLTPSAVLPSLAATLSPTPEATATPEATGTPEATATSAPSAIPTEAGTVAPTGVASPSTSGSPSQPATSAAPSPGEGSLADTLLTAEDLPQGLESQGVVEGSNFDIDQASFDTFGGEGIVSQVWRGMTGTVNAVFDFRMQFPDAASAESYLDAAEAVLSEEVASGLTETPIAETIGANTSYYSGQVTVPVTVDFHNFLFTVDDVAVKVFIAGQGATYEEALPIAEAAANRIALYQLMAHVPSEYADRCIPADSSGGVATQVNCTLAGDVGSAQYTLFETVDLMNQAFSLFAAENTPSDDAGSCQTGPHLGTYTIGEVDAGQLFCADDGTNYTIVWTDEEVRIMSVGSTSTAGYPELYEWWLNEAGPVR